MTDIYPAPCIHADGKSLCPDCRAAWEYDPESYDEYGDHPEGLRNWRDLQHELAALAEEAKRQPCEPDPDLPF